MSQIQFREGSLVLYKSRPALVTMTGEKITIQLDKKTVKRVRDKDIQLIHSGPLKSLNELDEQVLDLQEAWELLDGESCTLQDLVELVAEDFNPVTAWSTWLAVDQGLLFEGDPGKLTPRNMEAIEQDLRIQQEKQRQQAEEEAFLQNISNASLTADDRKKLSEVEMLANGLVDKSKILNMLNIKQSADSAHRFLVKCGYWDEYHNPFPKRNGIDLDQPDIPAGELPEENREDLTTLDAYAIDDASSSDPDDAISLDGNRLYVHVADVAALVGHDSELDMEARRRASNLYLPDTVVHMLPETVTERLGLGLQEISPALSISFKLLDDGIMEDIRIAPSRVKVTRLSYAQANEQMDTRFADIKAFTDKFRAWRLANGAAFLDLPEASVRIDTEGKVQIIPMDKLDSRQMVTDAMLMAGVAVARFCQENDIAIPYATQPEPAEIHDPKSLAEMYAYRRHFKASCSSMLPGAHFGLGLDLYTRATSPLRRYADLIVHQQLRKYISGQTSLDSEAVSSQLTSVDQQAGVLRKTERQSNLHWKLVYLKQNPDWQGEAVVVNIEERKTVIMIPELALETKIRTRENFALDDTISVRVNSVELPEQEVFFSLS